MAVSLIKPSVGWAGELAPSMWGHTEAPRFQQGASVLRNMFANYRGGSSSRAGLAYCGKCRQAASAFSTPPRAIRFQFNVFQSYILEFGDGYMSVAANGGYVTETALAVTAATQANPCELTVPGNSFAAGDQVYASGIGGMTQLNGDTFIVAEAGTSFTLQDIFGIPVNSLDYGAFTSGGAVARLYANLSSPYAAIDLPYLKIVQSADVMSLCCVNQQTGTEYPPVDLQRLAAANWNFETLTFASAIAAPAGVTATATVAGSAPYTQYAYVVTAVDSATGEESVASDVAYITESVDIAATAGSHIIGWSPVPGADQYNIYQAPASYDTAVPIGSNFGYVGFALGTQFVNTNITPDFATTPPLHDNPFARGAVLEVDVTAEGNGSYTQATVGYTVNSATGSGFIGTPIIVNGYLVGFLVQNTGVGFVDGDSIAITDSGGGAGGTVSLVVGPESGTYPSVPNYFQQRRAYAGTLNNPDTYWLSQTGAYLNFDAATPPIDSDAIIGTPWGEQVNGIQWLQSMPGGLLAATGLDTWQVSGTSGAGSLITPAQQSAVAQESNGYSATVQPLKIGYDILFPGATTTAVYDLVYNFWNNIYAGTEISVPSSHLFDNFQIVSWAWARHPFRLVWVTRNDGKFLSLTFLKEPENTLIAWARHDTNGLVVSNAVATEFPVDAPYFIVKRYIVGVQQWAYYLERMDNRAWVGAEDPWCVDAGLSLLQPAPDATLSAAAALGVGDITGGYLANGGTGYVAPTAKVIDPTGLGSGGAVNLVFTSGGAITGFTFVGGQNYSAQTYCQIIDPTGAGAALVLFISQNVLFIASAAVFADNNPGDVIRMGGGIATVTEIISPTQALASIVAPILQTIPNDPNNLPIPAAAGAWTITTPVTTLANLRHLEGMQVAVLADGAVVAGGDQPLITVVNGQITLPNPASDIKVGLPFAVQYQSMHTEMPGEPTIQGKPQMASVVVARVAASRGIQIGANRPVASTLEYQREAPWVQMQDVQDYASVGISANALPLFTGDKPPTPIGGGPQNWNGFENAPGMIAAQQLNPLPMNLLAMIPTVWAGETNSPE